MTTEGEQFLLLLSDPGLDCFTLGFESIKISFSGLFSLCLFESLFSTLQGFLPLLLCVFDCIMKLLFPALIQTLVVTQTLAQLLKLLEL